MSTIGKRLTVDQYDLMVANGILPEVTYLELIEGKIVEKCHMSPPSAVAAGLCADVLRGVLPRGYGWYVRECGPVRIPTRDSEPEPEVSIVRGKPREYVDRHPGPGDVAMVVEVTRWKDVDLKYNRALAATYASGGIPVYWIVNVAGGRLEVYSDPQDGVYKNIEIIRLDSEQVDVTIDGQVVGQIRMADLLRPTPEARP
ncbi:MAG: Uma2 family endonuclease [Isosphaeraceae bacterium]